MLIAFPSELYDNPDCYTENAAGYFVAKANATQSERKAINKYNQQWEYARNLDKQLDADLEAMKNDIIKAIGKDAFEKRVASM